MAEKSFKIQLEDPRLGCLEEKQDSETVSHQTRMEIVSIAFVSPDMTEANYLCALLLSLISTSLRRTRSR